MKYLIHFIFTLMLSTAVLANHENIMWDPQGYPEDNFRGDWFATIDTEAQEWAITTVEYNTRSGPTALRFELRDGDCFTAQPHSPSSGWDDCTRDRERTELRERWTPDLERAVWYTVSVFIPEDYIYMYPKQIFMQWHGGPGPVVYFQLNRDRFLVDILTEVGTTTAQYDLGIDLLTPGIWHDIVVRAVWSNRETGRFTLFIDGDVVLDHVGPTMDSESYAKGFGPFTKFGIYRSHLFRWQSQDPHPTQVLYFDEYYRGYDFYEVYMNRMIGD